jgi:hypothetical protein
MPSASVPCPFASGERWARAQTFLNHPEQGSRSEPPSKGSAMHAQRGKDPRIPAETWAYGTRRLDFARRDMRGASVMGHAYDLAMRDAEK